MLKNMSWTLFIVLFAVVIENGFGLDCTQIPSSSVFAGNTVHLPGPSDQLETIPANFNCLYKISVPGNSTYGLSASVLIRNRMRGANDYIKVVDITGYVNVLNNRSSYNNWATLIPGTEITIQVVTKSVYMASMFEITVEYLSTQVGPTFPMKTGGEMNYIDVASLRDGKSEYNSVTFVGTEPIYMSFATPRTSPNHCDDCYIIDGTIDNQTQIYHFDYENSFTTKSNAITILSSNEFFLGLVFNPKSEADKFYNLVSLAVGDDTDDNGGKIRSYKGVPGAVQVVNFERNGIIMDGFEPEGSNCTAYVVSGPPNNSSEILLDLSTHPKMPYSFDVKYLSVVALDPEECDFYVDVKGYRN